MRSIRISGAGVLLMLSLVSACGSGDDTGGEPMQEGDAASEGSSSLRDGGSDGSQREAAPEAGEAASEATMAVPDASDGSTDASGTSADASDAARDAGAARDGSTNVSDASIDTPGDATDASDAHSEAALSDAGDAGSLATDGNDAAAICLGSLSSTGTITGDYYVRSDGSVVNGSSNTVVVDASTGQPLRGVVQVALERFGGCALRGSDGTVWCWASFEPAPGFGGNNAGGQLGNGTFDEVTDSAQFFHATEVQTVHPDGGAAAYLTGVTALQSGSADPYQGAVCAIRNDKSPWCWGSTSQGSLWYGTIGTNANLAVATRIDLAADGGSIGVDQITVGGRHACFLSAGTVYCWGDNTRGELATGDTTTQPYPHAVALPSAATFVAAGNDVTCALAGGQVYCWGDTVSTGDPYVDASICNSNYCHPEPVPVQAMLDDGGIAALANQTKLFVGYQFGCASDDAGELRCWGSSGSGVVQEATVYVNPNSSSGVPSGPVATFSATGTDGYRSALRYVTQDGTLVSGSQKKTLLCP